MLEICPAVDLSFGEKSFFECGWFGRFSCGFKIVHGGQGGPYAAL